MADESPYIELRNGQPMIVSHRLSVVDVIGTLRASGYSTRATADYLRIDQEIVEACRVYEAHHQEEVDAEIEQQEIEQAEIDLKIVVPLRGGDRPVSAEEEATIRKRLASAASSRVADYPPELLRRLLDDARALRRLLDWERKRRRLLEEANALFAKADVRQTRFIFHAEAKGWITRHERDVLLNLRDDPATLRALTSWHKSE